MNKIVHFLPPSSLTHHCATVHHVAVCNNADDCIVHRSVSPERSAGRYCTIHDIFVKKDEIKWTVSLGLNVSLQVVLQPALSDSNLGHDSIASGEMCYRRSILIG